VVAQAVNWWTGWPGRPPGHWLCRRGWVRGGAC